MAILHKPGDLVEYVLPSDRERPPEEQTIVRIKVPEEATARKLANMRLEAKDFFAVAQVRLGCYLESIENLRFADGSTFVLEKEPDGKVTRKCITELQGVLNEIVELIEACTTLSDKERKNS